MNRYALKFSALLLFVCVVAVCGVRADAISITLDDPFLQGSPGTLLQFMGTLSNTTDATLKITGGNVSVEGFPVGSTSIVPQIFSEIAANDTTGDVELFTLSVPTAFPAGFYTGFLELFGGSGLTAYDSLGWTTFTVEVTVQEAAVPEPSSMLLLLTGIGSSLLWLRRR